MSSSFKAQRRVSAFLGVGLVAYSGYLTFEHSHEVTAPIIAVVGAAVFHLGETSLRSRKWITGVLFGFLGIFAVAISLYAVTDRMASRYDQTVQKRSSENTPRRLASVALTDAKTELATVTKVAMDECGESRKSSECRSATERETKARERVEAARQKLASLGEDIVVDPTARRIAWAFGVSETSVAAVVPMLPAIWLELAGILLLTYGLSPAKKAAPVAIPAAPAQAAPVAAAPVTPLQVQPVPPKQLQVSHAAFSRKGGLATAAKRRKAKTPSP